MRQDRLSLKLSVPSKTFLLGEYAVLNGGPALVMAHEPRFTLEICASESGCEGVSPQSPAGRFIRGHSQFFNAVGLRFLDPHEGRGGFGASSAQLVLAYAFKNLPQESLLKGLNVVDPQTLWKEYRELETGAKQLPSGADVVAQLLGGLAIVRVAPFESHSMIWPFENLEIVLAATGEKLATHEHLRERLPVSEALLALAEGGTNAAKNGEEDSFLSYMRQYADELERLQLVTAHTRGLVAQISAWPEVLSVKGCGAMGADVVAVASERSNVAAVKDKLKEMGLRVVSSSSQLSGGLRLEADLAPYFQAQSGEAWV